jgi:ribosome-associated protein
MTPVEIRDDMIRLGQLLQLAGIVDGGAEAKHLVMSGEVEVNGAVELRRGRQVRPGDVVTVGGVEVQVVRV